MSLLSKRYLMATESLLSTHDDRVAGQRKNMKLSILIADDYAVVRRGLRALLEAQPGWRVVGEADNGRQAAEQCTLLRPDVAILDISMPVLNGLDAARLILKAAPETRVLVLTAYHTDEMIEKAL